MGVKDGYEPLRMPGQSYENHSHFLRESQENTLTWGDTEGLTIDPATFGEGSVAQTRQLVHVRRHRPTTFTVAVSLKLGQGWNGESATRLTLDVLIGVGQAFCTIRKTYDIPTPASGTLPVNDIFTVPASAVQCQAGLSIPGGAPAAGIHDAQVTILCAPVYA